MLLISNRGNINGPNSLLENTPDYIDSTIDQGYNVKIDLWYIHDKCFLGQDGPKNEVSWEWIIKNADYLWVNCMNTSTFSFLLENAKPLNFFYNKLDSIAMTSQGFAWSNNNDFSKGTIVYNTDAIEGVLGVCSDTVSKWSKQIAICFYGEAGLPNKKTIKNHNDNMITPLTELGYHLEYYGSKRLNHKENDLKFNKIYNFKGLRSHLADNEKESDDLDKTHIASIYEMIGSHPYETAFFIRWDQKLTSTEIIDHIKTYDKNEN